VNQNITGPKPKRFFDDWTLTVGSASGMGAFLRIEMPHNPKQPVTQITGSTVEIQRLANTLDKLLCELTGTKTERVTSNGTN
jgi:hypothetical protein